MPAQPPRFAELTEPERRLLTLARDDMPLAELAVRLGVPVGDAATRLESLCARLGVPDRAALRTLSFGDGPAAEGPAATPGATPNRYSRRRILSAGIAGGLAIAGGAAGLAYWATRGGPNSPAAAPSPTHAPSAMPSATATSTPINQLTLIEEVPLSTWETRTLAPGEQIGWESGAFYMDIDTGAVNAWRLAADAAPKQGQGLSVHRVVRGGELITAQPSTDEQMVYALHRGLKRAFRWPANTIFLMDSLGDGFTFSSSAMQSPQRTFIAKADLSLRSMVTATKGGLRSEIAESPNGGSAVVFEGSAQGDSVELRSFSLETGETLMSRSFQARSGEFVQPQGIFPIPGDREFMAGLTYMIPDKANPPGVVRTTRLRLPWAGRWDLAAEDSGPPVGSFSPDGRSESRPAVLRQSREQGLGGVGDWTAMTINDLDGPQRFAVLSASAPFFNFGSSDWVSDGSALVMMVEDVGEGSGYTSIRYVLADAGGNALTPLKLPPPPATSYVYPDLWRTPVPCPNDPAVVALGLVEVLNLRTGTSLRANLGGVAPPVLGMPWMGRSRELAFALPQGGKDGPGLPSFIAPSIIRTALPKEPLEFTVARTGDCLNVRNGPTLKDEVIACIADGTPLTLADRYAIEGASTASYARNEDGAWVYVSTSGGLQGWVAAAYLDWAV